MTFDEANNYLKSRINEPTRLNSAQLSATLDKRMRAQAFFSAKVADSRVLERMRRMSDAYSRGETDLATLRSDFKQWLQREAPEAAQGKGIENIGSTARLNLVLRQNAAMAASVGRYQVSRSADVEDRWPCWRYIAGHNPRPSHAALDGKVFLKSDPIWHKIYPPWDFNCNCDVEDAELPAGGADHARAEDIQGTESGFEFDPADAFTEFDTEAITSEFDRSNTIAAMQDQFGAEPAEDNPGVLTMPDEDEDAKYERELEDWRKSMKALHFNDNAINLITKGYPQSSAKYGPPPVVRVDSTGTYTGLNADGTELIIGTAGDQDKIIKTLGNLRKDYIERRKTVARVQENVREFSGGIGCSRIDGTHDWKMDAEAVNPHYIAGAGGPFENNCQRCIAAYDARRKGLNVVAKPRPDNDTLQNDNNWADNWKHTPADLKTFSRPDGAYAEERVAKIVLGYPPGARCAVRVNWSGRKGHVFIAENHGGHVVYLDPQQHGKTENTNYTSWINECTGKDCAVMRIDDKEFADTAKLSMEAR